MEYVIFTADATKRFEDFSDADFVNTEPKIGIKYAVKEAADDTVLLLQYRCPYPDCDVASAGWPGLHLHVKDVHQRKMCNFCVKSKKVFTHEVQLFTDQELKKHMREGDDRPGAVDQTGFRGHPLCGFCGSRHYGVDELYDHLKKVHEKCFICSNRDPRNQPVYFANITDLQDHYRAQHFLCSEPECVSNQLIVFATELDLKAHQLEVHGNTLSKDVRRDARMVDISGFNYRESYQQQSSRGDRRDGRNRGRGRDPNSEPLPVSSAQPLRRDEQAFQRQMAIQSAQSVAPRTFGGQLTSTPVTASGSSRGANSNPPQQSNSVGQAGNAMARLDVSAEERSAPAVLTPQDQARALRHSAVIERASSLLRNDQTKLAQFRNTISSYQRNGISATALIESFQSLFDTSSSNLGILVRELADIFEDESKASSLRAAWNDWRAINEDFPSLPGLNLTDNSIPLGWAITGSSSNARATQNQNSSRILKLKSSTAQSLRSFDSSGPSRSSAAAKNKNNSHASNVAFPGLPPASGSNSQSNTANRGTASSSPWIDPSGSTSNQSSASNSNPPSTRPSPPTSRPASKATRGGANGDAFPALPPAPKPQSSLTSYGGRLVRRDLGGSSANASSSKFSWGGGGAAGGGNEDQVEAEGGAAGCGGGAKKKGNKGKKQVLMNWG